MSESSPTSPKSRLVYCVGATATEGQVIDFIKSNLESTFSETEENYDWQIEAFKKPSEAIEALKKEAAPSLTTLHPDAESFPENSSEWDTLCGGLKALDPQACILTILENEPQPSAEQSIQWLDRGASGLWNPQAESDNSRDLLRELLTLPLKTHRPRHARVEAVHKISIRLSSFEQAIAAETLNIGTGGLFIRSVPSGVNTGDTVSFTLEFTNTVSLFDSSTERDSKVDLMNADEQEDAASSQEKITGDGRIVWIRQTAQGDLPEGMGVQFTSLSEDNFKKIQEFVASRRVKAFIPKG